MFENNWRQLSDGEYGDFQRFLLARKGSDEQVKFLETVREKQLFLVEMNRILKEGSEHYPTPDWKFTEREFDNPPACTEAKIYDHWINLCPHVASRPGFWAQVAIDLVRNECIDPVFLAGQKQLSRVLRNYSQGQNSSAEIDQCVRDVLRRMSGIQSTRGNRSVFADCRLARAWWRESIFRRVAREATEDQKLQIGQALRISKEHWEKFAGAMVSRNPVFGNDLVQNAFVTSLTAVSDARPKSDYIRKACQNVCIIGGSIELSILAPSAIQEIVDGVITGLETELQNDIGEDNNDQA